MQYCLNCAGAPEEGMMICLVIKKEVFLAPTFFFPGKVAAFIKLF